VALAKTGVKVYVNYSSSRDAADETVNECLKFGDKIATVLPFNVACKDEVEQAIGQIKEESGGLDILVNNAGITYDSLLLRTKDEDWQRVMDVNLTGTFLCCRAALRLILKRSNGRIVNISSVVGEMGNPGQVAYVSSKAAVIGLTKSLAKELGGKGITVNAVAPGFIDTDMTSSLDESQRDNYLGVIPLKKFGQPQDVAEAVRFLCSVEAGYVTGQVLGVNGGLYM
jgi:3-oxoacyl-[acyl-carrier protein] reductase